MQAKFVSPDINQTNPEETVYSHLARDEKNRMKNGNGKEEIDIVMAVFKKQPPDNLRKSNFFHFDLSLFDTNKNEVLVEKATFVGFQEDEPGEKKLRNGIIYKLEVCFANGKKQTSKILVRLIDSSTKKPISYDGQDKNPDMCRVLLTHEVMCSRCCENKSCGNRNETPSDPSIMNNGLITRYFMKCNQNCLKNAGNPRETRRFQVMIGLIRKTDILQLVTSENMFVHNNSKHGRRSNMVHDHLVAHSPNDLAVKFPMIHYVIPQTGRLGGGDEVAILGEHFFEGIQIAFGNQFAFQTDVLNVGLIKVRTPPCVGPAIVDIKIVYDSKIYLRGKAPQFRYNPDSFDVKLDFYMEKLWSILPKPPMEIDKPAREIVLCRAVETLEYVISTSPIFCNPSENGHHSIHNLTPSIPIGSSNLSITQNGKDANNSCDETKDQSLKNQEYSRNNIYPNSNGTYDPNMSTQGYIMTPLLFGMNQLCDAIPNASQLYLPYQGVYDPSQITMNVNFPSKRPYSNENTMLSR